MKKCSWSSFFGSEKQKYDNWIFGNCFQDNRAETEPNANEGMKMGEEFHITTYFNISHSNLSSIIMILLFVSPQEVWIT